MSPDYRLGDVVKLTGTVVGLTGDTVVVQFASSREIVCASDLSLVERAKPQPPQWQDGDVIHNAITKDTLVRKKGCWYTADRLLFWHDDPSAPNRNLIPVVMGGVYQ